MRENAGKSGGVGKSARQKGSIALVSRWQLTRRRLQAPDPKSEEAGPFVKKLFNPVLELTHNHGTETQDDFAHFTGNEADRKGFGHIGFLVEDVEATCTALEQLGASFKKKPLDGTMKGLAFAQDPDGYWIEVIKRGGYDDQATPFWKDPA